MAIGNTTSGPIINRNLIFDQVDRQWLSVGTAPSTSPAISVGMYADCEQGLSPEVWESLVSAKKLAPMWRANRLNDFAVLPADDWRSIPKRLINWNTDKVMAAAANDIVLTEAFLRIVQLLDPPSRLLQPSLLARVIAGNRRRAHTPTNDTAPGRRSSDGPR